MPNATIKYKLPEEQIDFDLANKAGKWYSVLWDLDQYLRNKLKYGHNFKTGDKALEETRKHLHELMEENNVSFDEVQ